MFKASLEDKSWNTFRYPEKFDHEGIWKRVRERRENIPTDDESDKENINTNNRDRGNNSSDDDDDDVDKNNNERKAEDKDKDDAEEANDDKVADESKECKIVAYENTINSQQRQLYKKQKKIEELKGTIKGDSLKYEILDNEYQKLQRDYKSLEKKWNANKMNVTSILEEMKKVLDKDAAANLMIKMAKIWVGSECKLLAKERENMDKLNQKKIDEQRTNWDYKLKLAIDYAAEKYTYDQIRGMHDTSTKSVIIGPGSYVHHAFNPCTQSFRS